MKDILVEIRRNLKRCADKNTRLSNQRFFKEKVKLYGVKAAVVGKVSRKYLKLIKGDEKKNVFRLCETLWKSGYIEESVIACDLSYYLRMNYEPDDFILFEKWVNKYVGNWASCDTLCNHTIGAFIEKFPAYLSHLKRWAKSKNRWVRRASAVSLIIPARQGKFLNDIFEIVDILLSDKDDLVQKGYGWLLKAASQAHPDAVFNYVIKKKKTMPRTALRYAIEKMPEGWRKQAMKIT